VVQGCGAANPAVAAAVWCPLPLISDAVVVNACNTGLVSLHGNHPVKRQRCRGLPVMIIHLFIIIFYYYFHYYFFFLLILFTDARADANANA
jgi:hypothetical protein